MKNKTSKKLTQRSDDFAPIDPSHLQRMDLTSRTYQLRIDTINEKDRTVEAVIATEAVVRVFDWNRLEVIEEVLLMSGCRIPPDRQIPLLDTHDRTTIQKQHGSTRNLRIEGDKLIGQAHFSSSKETDHAWTLTREGHLRDHSAGYKVYNSVSIPAGEKAVVAGREFQASANYDLRISIDWEPKEDTICVIGADSTAKNRSTDAKAMADKNENKNLSLNGKDKPMEEFKKWLASRGLEYDKLSENTRAAMQKDFDEEQKRAEAANKTPAPAAAATDDSKRTADSQPVDAKKIAEEASRAAVEAERKRVAEITALGGDDVKREIIAECITAGKTIEAAREIVLGEIRKSRPPVKSVPAGIASGIGSASREIIEDGLMLRAGYEDIILKDKTSGQQRAEAANKVRDISLLDVCRMALQIEGREVPMGREDCIRAAFSTHSLAQILGNVANKALLRGYQLAPETWSLWCTIGEAVDFKTMTKVRLSQNSTLREVGSGGKIASGSTEEEYEQYSIATYAEIMSFTRQQIINDDLQALTRVPQGMGAAAKALIGDLVYTHLMANGTMQDGTALFVSGHANLNTGAALAEGTIKTAVTALAKQKNKAGRNLNIPAKFLIVPPDLKFTARELVKSANIIIAGAGDSVRGNVNTIAEEDIQVVSEPRLSNTSFSGYSTTSWYLAGDKALVDTIEVSFLRGKQEPTLEQVPTASDVLGVQYRIFHDAGCKALDHRGIQKNTA